MALNPPSEVILEVSAVCNIRCKGCAFHGPQRFTTRPTGFMEETVWKSVLEQTGSWNRTVSIIAHGGGEPLLHPHLKDILKTAKSYSNLCVGFLTNGMLLNREWAEFVVSAGLDWVGFSVDGISQDSHQIVRKNSDLNMITANIGYLLEVIRKSGGNKPRMSLNMVAYEEVMDQTDAFIRQWIDKVDSVTISHYRNPPSSKRWLNAPSERKPCALLWRQMVIGWNGEAGLCCEDFNLDYPIGNVRSTPLSDIWNGKRINDVRALNIEGFYDRHPICAQCDTWADSVVCETIEDVRKGYRITKRASQTEYLLLKKN